MRLRPLAVRLSGIGTGKTGHAYGRLGESRVMIPSRYPEQHGTTRACRRRVAPRVLTARTRHPADPAGRWPSLLRPKRRTPTCPVRLRLRDDSSIYTGMEWAWSVEVRATRRPTQASGCYALGGQRLGTSAGAAVSRESVASMRSFRCCTGRGRRRQAECVGDDGLGGAQHRGEQRRQVEVALARCVRRWRGPAGCRRPCGCGCRRTPCG